MKAPSFDYVKPDSLDDVLALLAQHGDDARILAGGQTLLATLNMRLSEPELLIDINAVEALKGIEAKDDHLWIGALVRHSQIEDSPVVAQHAPLLMQAAPHVGHRAIRNQGTFGGSIAFADPAAEWPVCTVALDAVFHLAGSQGVRKVPAAEFFLDLYTTEMASDEMLIGCEIPFSPPDTKYAFQELARRHGDYAIVGVAATAQMRGGAFNNARLVFLGMGNTPIRALDVEQLVEGKAFSDDLVSQAKQALVGVLQPSADLYSSANTKMHLAGVLMGRVLKQLAESA